MEKVTKALSAKVVTEDGKVIGRVVDLRSDGDPEHGITNKQRAITGLLFRERRKFSLRRPAVKLLPWNLVKRHSPGRFVVKQEAVEKLHLQLPINTKGDQ